MQVWKAENAMCRSKIEILWIREVNSFKNKVPCFSTAQTPEESLYGDLPAEIIGFYGHMLSFVCLLTCCFLLT